jgi:hypothetical protein
MTDSTTNYKLGTKLQGKYKGKSLKAKAKEFVSTAVKQTIGSLGITKKLKNPKFYGYTGPVKPNK